MEFLYVLEKLRHPILDEIMLLVTRLGEETAFLVAALVVFWCVDKRKGYYVMAVGFAGTLLNQFLKLWFRVPRPWVLDPDFTIVERAREAATGYSFPSGHSTSSVGTFGALAAATENRRIRWLWIAVAVLVPVSRMYLGVHTPMDVLVGAGIALVLVFLLRPMLGQEGDRVRTAALMLTLVLALGLLLFAELYPFPENMDPHNMESGVKNAYTMLGSIAGVALVCILEPKYVKFETKAPFRVQLLKILLGLGTVLAIKEGLRTPLEMLLPVYPARAVRYFLVVIWAGLGWSGCFPILAKMGVKK